MGSAEYIVKNGGLDTEKDYSYWSVGEMCNKNREGASPLTGSLSYSGLPYLPVVTVIASCSRHLPW